MIRADRDVPLQGHGLSSGICAGHANPTPGATNVPSNQTPAPHLEHLLHEVEKEVER